MTTEKADLAVLLSVVSQLFAREPSDDNRRALNVVQKLVSENVSPQCVVRFSTNTDAFRESGQYEAGDVLSQIATSVDDGFTSGQIDDTDGRHVGWWSLDMPRR